MPTYKIEQAFGAGETYTFTGSDGGQVTLVPYTAILSGPEAPNQPVTINRLPDSPAPAVGEELEGTIKQTKRGPTFKKADNYQGGSSNGGQQQMSPERTRSIERQTCVKAAGPILAALTRKEDWRTTFAEDATFIVDTLHHAVGAE